MSLPQGSPPKLKNFADLKRWAEEVDKWLWTPARENIISEMGRQVKFGEWHEVTDCDGSTFEVLVKKKPAPPTEE